MHDFKSSLAFSHNASDWEGWKAIYESFFGEGAHLVDHRQDGDHQRAGIDRSVILPNSRQVLVDEKVRGRNRKTGKVYSDIALEFWSDRDRQERGWIAKALRCEFIAYAILPLGVCYLLPFQQLRAAWKMNCKAWVEKYHKRTSDNKDPVTGREWTTVFCPVPQDVVFRAIAECSIAKFEPIEFEE